MSGAVVGLEPDRGTELSNGLVQLALVSQGVTEVEMTLLLSALIRTAVRNSAIASASLPCLLMTSPRLE